MSRHPWAEFFDGHAPRYEENEFTRHTADEVPFLLELLELPPGAAILDVGCGTGRHAVELARRGFRVTGVDVSAGMLARARQAASRAGVGVAWIQADAERFRADFPHDAAICLCEGAFSLHAEGGSTDHDALVLQAIRGSLRERGRLVLNALHAPFVLRTLTDREVEEGRFDLARMVGRADLGAEAAEGLLERYYTAPELAALLRRCGFEPARVFGGTAGRWGRRAPALDDIELMAVAVAV